MNRLILSIVAAGCVVAVLLVWSLRPMSSPAASTETPVPRPDRSEAAVSATDLAAARPTLDAASTSSVEARVQAARVLVADQLRGSANLRFRNERVLQDGQIVCMEVAVAAEKDRASPAFTKAVVITRPDRTPSVWVDRGHEVVAHIACELA